MPSRIAKRKSLPGRQAAAARAVLRASPADAGEAERLSALPPWARTRIAELEDQIDNLRSRLTSLQADHARARGGVSADSLANE